jgi:hypothetical protein
MERAWYHKAKECTSLRKHVLRVDMCIFIDDETAFANLNFLSSTIKSILTASIINGLDIIGVLSSSSPSVGWKAAKMASDLKMDIVVVPGQTYICKDNEEIYIYKLRKPVPLGLSIDKACEYAHKQGGFVIASNVGKRQSQLLEKLQNSIYAPDAIEIFNGKTGGFRDLNVDYPSFVSSGATSATDLENSNSFTLLDRNKAVDMKLIGEEQGVGFTPKYLQPKTPGAI